MPDKYDEFGRLIEKPAKPKKLEWDSADYPFTFAVSVVNRKTGEGVKDFEATEKIKTVKGAAKKAWKDATDRLGGLGHGQRAGDWVRAQDRDDLDLVVRPVTAQRDIEQYRGIGSKMFSFPDIVQAYDHVASPPGRQDFYVPEEKVRAWFYDTGSHGPSTIIPLLDVVE